MVAGVHGHHVARGFGASCGKFIDRNCPVRTGDGALRDGNGTAGGVSRRGVRQSCLAMVEQQAVSRAGRFRNGDGGAGPAGGTIAASPRLGTEGPRTRRIAGVGAAILLFILYGFSPGTDAVAHFGGLVAGLGLGAILSGCPHGILRSLKLNLVSGLYCSRWSRARGGWH